MIQCCLVLHNIATTRRDYIEPIDLDDDETDVNSRIRPLPTEAGVALRQHYVDRYFS